MSEEIITKIEPVQLQRYALRRSYREQYPNSGDTLIQGAHVVIYLRPDYGLADMDALHLGRPCISISTDLEKGLEPFYVVVQDDLVPVQS